MHHVLALTDPESDACRAVCGAIDAASLLPERIVHELDRLRSGRIDNLVLQNLPVPENLPPTPTEIRGAPHDIAPAHILRSIGNYLGTISPKGIENTIRFRLSNSEATANEETWHGHYQYRFSLFYCLREDERAKIYLFSANDFMREAPNTVRSACLTPQKYLQDKEPFALVSHGSTGYEITHEIYDRSDFEKTVKDLDLPDVMKALERIVRTNPGDEKLLSPVEYLMDRIQNHSPYHIYRRGDITMYSDASTMRYSPVYAPSTEQAADRWLLAMAVA